MPAARVAVVWLFSLSTLVTAQASPEGPRLLLPEGLKPFRSTIDYARQHQVPISGIPPMDHATAAAIGDEVTALVEFHGRAQSRQWLVNVRITSLNKNELPKKPPAPLVLFTSTGHRLEYPYEPVALEFRTFGPFRAATQNQSAEVTEKRARAVLNRAFLAMGLDRACLTGLRIKKMAEQTDPKARTEFAFGTDPFPPPHRAPPTVDSGSKVLTLEDEHAFAGMLPALLAFFTVAENSPGLQDILTEIVDARALAWSFLRHGGRLEPHFKNHTLGIAPIESRNWGLSHQPVYRFPFELSLNGRPTLNCAMAVTSATSPLLASAGILGLTAEPTRPDGRRLLLRIIAARQAVIR